MARASRLPIADVDRRIREGDVSTAASMLASVRRTAIPRSELVTHAQLARRVGDYALALRWLKPVVRGRPGLRPEPTDEEALEYAASLNRLGLTEEAAALLAPLDAKKTPRVLFERAAAAIHHWDYAAAIEPLRAYLADESLDSYARLVAQVNLASALVYEGHTLPATPLLRELLHETSVRKLPLLLGNVFQLTAILLVGQKDYAAATAFLARAGEVLGKPSHLDALLVEKWRAVVELYERGPSAERIQTLEALGAKLSKLGHGESLRDCVRHVALATGDAQRFALLYFGTPYASYRSRLLSAAGENFRPPEALRWNSEGRRREGELDLREALREEQRTVAVDANRLALRTLLTLASDLFVPFPVTRLFSTVYRGERYDAHQSPNRVHQAVRTLRQWLRKEAKGVRVEETSGNYRLALEPGWTLVLPPPLTLDTLDPAARALARLRQVFGGEPFSAQQAALHLAVSSRTALRLLAPAVESRTLEKQGARRGARYRFT